MNFYIQYKIGSSHANAREASFAGDNNLIIREKNLASGPLSLQEDSSIV